MSTGAAGDGLLRGIFEASMSGSDTAIQRRPYHKNCTCALHKSRGHCCHVLRSNNVSFPIRRTWSEGCLVAAADQASGSGSPPAVVAAEHRVARTHSQSSLRNIEE
ncbi:uncharacterized protein LOC127806091 [Diospyros lotus]|uniref:uncharacterized protein LOC127806091 n=1 Tax=Diospyros lotus TaxID=55363 RepID=UPI002254A1CF|nr:uncharacterized protein LOC127806091 [Diospyros lotus]